MTTFKLEPMYDSRKSFYGKAVVERTENEKKLLSYGTHVASVYFKEEGAIAEVFDTYSNTTLRHIKDFLYQSGFEVGNKAFIEKTYIKGDN